MRLLPKKQLQIRGRIVGGERVLFCLPLQEKNADMLYRQAQSLKALAPDIVEWRLDGFSGEKGIYRNSSGACCWMD